MKHTHTLPFPIDAPPHFRGLDPELPIEVTHRRLPHWRQEGATYFVTARLGDSLPKEAIGQVDLLREDMKRMEWTLQRERERKGGVRVVNAQDLAGERMKRYRTLRAFEENWLDAGHGACYFRNPSTREVLSGALQFFHPNPEPDRGNSKCRERYWLGAFVIMPNHFHGIVKPFPGESLGKILGSWKQFSAKQIGHGSIWQEESYDQIVRDEYHLQKVIRYLAKNPVSAKLREGEFALWMCPEWAETDWRFPDVSEL